MERKLGTTATIAPEEVKASLSKERGLTAEEEKLLRMSNGVSVDPDAPLAKAAAGELADELLLMEMDLFRAHRPMVSGRRGRSSTTSAAAPADARAKSKIIRALRRKR